MGKGHFNCVICKKSSDKMIVLDEEKLQKCKHFLKIRKDNNLKFSDVILPENVTQTDGDSVITKDTEEPITVDEIPLVPVNIENVEICKEKPDIRASVENPEQYGNEDVTVTNTNVCLFCTKSAKKWKGQMQKLCDLDKASLKQAIEPFLSFVSN
ncbi:hypothetical protein PV325_011131, partial [Microctonus aethiopoides]